MISRDMSKDIGTLMEEFDRLLRETSREVSGMSAVWNDEAGILWRETVLECLDKMEDIRNSSGGTA